MATDPSGDHLKLAYDQEGTWSLKYNGFADRLLGLNLVPSAVAAQEAAWYLSRANTDGVPLDLRHTYTKADWELWTAAWLSAHHEIRDLLIESVYQFADVQLAPRRDDRLVRHGHGQSGRLPGPPCCRRLLLPAGTGRVAARSNEHDAGDSDCAAGEVHQSRHFA